MQFFKFLKWVWLSFLKFPLWNKIFILGAICFVGCISGCVLSIILGWGITLKLFMSAYVSFSACILLGGFIEIVNWVRSQYRKFVAEQDAEAAEIVRRLQGR